MGFSLQKKRREQVLLRWYNVSRVAMTWAQRLKLGYQIKLIEIPSEKRGKQANIQRIIEKESEKKDR